MTLPTPKAESVHEDGTSDGWTPVPGFLRDVGPDGQTQVVVSVPLAMLAAVHAALVGTLAEPISLLYRQIVDRRNPGPNGAPPRDFVAVDLRLPDVLAALAKFDDLVYHDARCQIWVRGSMGEQVVLDDEGLVFCAPDDPVFEDVLVGFGLPPELSDTIKERNYPKHWFHGACDAQEEGLIAALQLTEISAPGRAARHH